MKPFYIPLIAIIAAVLSGVAADPAFAQARRQPSAADMQAQREGELGSAALKAKDYAAARMHFEAACDAGRAISC